MIFPLWKAAFRNPALAAGAGCSSDKYNVNGLAYKVLIALNLLYSGRMWQDFLLVGWAALGHELGPNGVYHFLVYAAERKTMEDGRRTSLVPRFRRSQ
ncbi:MAG: hypothetical protein ACE5HX_01830 [bacterium]